MKKIILLTGKVQNNAITHNRIMLPFAFCHEKLLEEDIELIQKEEVSDEDQPFDAIYFSRMVGPEYVQFIQQLVDDGVHLGLSLDDDLWNLEDGNPAKVSYGKLALDTIDYTLTLATNIAVSTKPLNNQIKKYTKNVTICKNLIDLDAFPDKSNVEELKVEPHNGIRCFWTGTHSHADDIELLVPAIKTLLEEPDYEFYFQSDLPKEFQAWNRIPGSNLANLKPIATYGNRLGLVNGVPLEQYLLCLASIDADVALIPLQANKFNTSKSNLTFLNHAYTGTPIVCSNVGPHLDLQDYAIVTDDFEYGIKHYKDIDTVKTKEYVAEEWSWQNSDKVEVWLEFFRSLC